MGRFDGRTALVTGAASGIGAATALQLAREGAAVAGLDVQKPAPDAWKRVEEAARAASFHTGSVASESEVRAALDRGLDCGTADSWVPVHRADGTKDWVQVADSRKGKSHVDEYGFPSWSDDKSHHQFSVTWKTRNLLYIPCPYLSNVTEPCSSRCSCLANAVNVSSSADPTALTCQCAAGFEPSLGNSSCLACGVGKAKAEVGNHGCPV